MEAVTSCGDRLVGADEVEEHVFKGYESVENLVACEGEENETGSHQGIHKVMVRGSNYGSQYERRIPYAQHEVEQLPKWALAGLSSLQRAAEDPGVVNQGHADAEGISEVHRGHGSQGVNVLAAHPNALSVVVANRVQKTVFRREKSRWHAGIENEGHEGAEVGQRHGSAGNGEGVEGRRYVVVPADEA